MSAEPVGDDATAAWKEHARRYGGSPSTPRMVLEKLMSDVVANRAVFSPGVGPFQRAEDFMTFATDVHALRYADIREYLAADPGDFT
jgi:hypothetical protein